MPPSRLPGHHSAAYTGGEIDVLLWSLSALNYVLLRLERLALLRVAFAVAALRPAVTFAVLAVLAGLAVLPLLELLSMLAILAILAML